MLKINSVCPDFQCKTSEGDISFHEWLGDSWGVLFSHPKDFTPVCTTELGSLGQMKAEFDARNVKVIGLSVDGVEDHKKWLEDIKDVSGTKPNYPIIADEDLKVDFGIKVYGAIYCARAALPYLKKSGNGVIINTTTPGGKASSPGTQPTSLSRAAGISLTKSWAGELAEFNIRVNTVCVGLLKSGQHRTRWQSLNSKNSDYSLEDHWETMGKNVPLGRVGEAEEVGDVMCFIASSKASYITGTAINVDGGTAPVV